MAKDNTVLLLAGAALVGGLFWMKKAGAFPGDKPSTDPDTGLPPVLPPVTPPVSPPVTPPVGPTSSDALAVSLANNLKTVQAKYGPKNSKGKENQTLVNQFQAREGLTGKNLDGKAGPGTLILMARYVSDLPLVMYWPRSANRKNVLAYRVELLRLAETSTGSRASELRASSERERGQAGIVGPLA